jgi:hypothetical protein
MKRRRGAREGMVRQRLDGRWEGRIDLGWVDGKRQRKYIYARTQADLRENLTRLLHERDRGLLPAKGASPTLARFLADWLASIKTSVRVRSYESYEGIIRLHLLPTLGRTRIEKLTPKQVQALLDAKVAGGLSQRTDLKGKINLWTMVHKFQPAQKRRWQAAFHRAAWPRSAWSFGKRSTRPLVGRWRPATWPLWCTAPRPFTPK